MKYDRRAIMKNAWEIRRESGCTMSAALKKAWAVAKKGNKMFDEESLKNFIHRGRNVFASREEALDAFAAGLNVPAINGRSDKQIEYARDLRDRMLYRMMGTNSDEFVEEILEAMFVRDMSADERTRYADERGETADEFVNSYIKDLSNPKVFLVLTEGDARKLIDGLKY